MPARPAVAADYHGECHKALVRPHGSTANDRDRPVGLAGLVAIDHRSDQAD